ncbi:Aminoacyl-tRNA synthetase, class II (D/K/N) [Dillenia turbinata]|uniref:Lysine--tRNA ligase n=1 Tax=Dillenia turbinata TaxID=194707 RepID=A0AAN8Z504_9MAGN
MEALKVSSRPLRHLLHMASAITPSTSFFIAPRRTLSPRFFLRCCSSSSSSTSSSSSSSSTATKVGGRNRRSSSTSASPASSSTSDRDAIRSIRLKKVEELRSKGLEPYAYKWERTHTADQLHGIYKNLGNGEESNSESDHVSIAGRIVARRAFGKLAFLTLRDDSGTIQLYCEKERLQDDQFEQLKIFVDIGDILGVTGSMKRTEKDTFYSSTTFRIPTKFFELRCSYMETGYINKLQSIDMYVDMIANPEVADTFRKRAKIVSEIRKTVESLGFVEVETPVLQGAAGGAEARPFITYHSSLGRNLFLRIATELHLKRMLVGGFEKVYEIGRIFRNEGISTRHNPEFTTIEMYEAYSDYQSMMNMAEEIVTRCALAVHGKLSINYQGTEICLERPWRRETMHNLVKEATGIDFNELGNDVETAKAIARKTLREDHESKEIASIEVCTSVGHVLNEVFEIAVEPKLLQPTFVLDYPIEISPLAKPHRRHAGLTERFELFICGRELGNAFSELTDPIDQRGRLEEQVRQHNKKRALTIKAEDHADENQKRSDDDSYEVTLDDDFLTALEYGMPPASGMGLGIDRLVMLLTDSGSIRDTGVAAVFGRGTPTCHDFPHPREAF